MYSLVRITTVALLALVVLLGCSSGYAPVSDRSIRQNNSIKVVRSNKGKQYSKPPSYYKVKKGDTLYSIAWRYDLDFRKVAKLNRITRPDRIYVGQTLKLINSAAPQKTTVQKKPKQNKPVIKKTSSSTLRKKQKKASVSAKPAVKKSRVGKTKAVKVSATKHSVKWRWPVAGRMIQGYSVTGNVNKGINLAGRRGEPVYAAATGTVVYAGDGLLGYGRLIIINHNQDFLSAYAHNSRILVKEGVTVKQGQKIAEMGSSGTTRVMLHFEIRKDGKPVNPIRYLPKR